MFGMNDAAFVANAQFVVCGVHVDDGGCSAVKGTRNGMKE